MQIHSIFTLVLFYKLIGHVIVLKITRGICMLVIALITIKIVYPFVKMATFITIETIYCNDAPYLKFQQKNARGGKYFIY